MFLLGLFMALNFQWTDLVVYKYWPIFLIVVTLAVLFLPAKLIYYRSRRWWAYSNVRIVSRVTPCLLIWSHFLSGASFSRASTLSSFEIFSLATCTARKHTLLP